MPGTLVIIKSDGTVEKTHIEEKSPGVEPVQAAVKGYFTVIKVRYKGRTRTAYVNEEGLSMNLDPNPYAFEMVESPGIKVQGMVFGDMAIWVPGQPDRDLEANKDGKHFREGKYGHKLRV